ncbi:adipose-secreted signaling protein-like [Glandiceps talaboti]
METEASTENNEVHHHHIKGGVKFPEDVHEPDIIVKKTENSSVDVNLGFLQKDHRYIVNFTIEDDVGENVEVFPEQHFCIKVLGAFSSQNGNGHDLQLELVTRKDGVMQEEFQLKSQTDESKHVKIILHARVLGRHKGTPLLKDGIHSIGYEVPEDESEASDWAGFD